MRGKKADLLTEVRVWILIIQEGETTRTVAEKVGISHASVYRITGGKKNAMKVWREKLTETQAKIDVPPHKPPRPKGGKRRRKKS